MRKHALFLSWLLLSACALPAGATDFATQVLQGTYKIFNKASTATGFFVADPAGKTSDKPGVLLVTANHVFERAEGENDIVVLRTAKPDGSFVRRDFSFPIRAEGKPLWYKHPTQDVAILRVALPADAEVKPIAFESLASEEVLQAVHFHVVSQIFVFGYPTQFEVNNAAFPVARNATVASYPIFPLKIFPKYSADFTTFAGDSGGPVFMSDSRRGAEAETAPPLIVGMVLAQWRHDETQKGLYEERYIHYPLALSVVLHAAFLREAIEQSGQ